MPPTVDLTLTDRSGQLTFTLDNPAPMATVEIAGLQDGQAVSQGDTFQLTVDAVPPLDQSSVAIPDPTKPATGFFAWIDQDGSTCHPYILPGPPSAPDQWNLDFKFNCADLSVGPAFLRVTFERPTPLVSCPTGSMCSGDTEVDWKEVAVSYGN
jgi:hypothetical protein